MVQFICQTSLKIKVQHFLKFILLNSEMFPWNILWNF